MVVIDTSAWFAFLDEEDSQMQKADDIFMDLKLKDIRLPDLVYYEILTVLKIKASNSEQGFSFFQSFINSIGLKPEKTSDRLLKKAEDNIFSHKGKFSFVDMVLLAYAQNGHEVITFDRELGALVKQEN